MCAAQLSWNEQGFPAFDTGPDGFPRPGQVIRHFRQQKLKENGKTWTQRDLAQVLGKRELAVREMELRDIGLNDITLRRFLAELFAIPSKLLGLAVLPEECTTESSPVMWWVRQGFPAFDAGSGGFPRPGQVIRYFRQQKLKTDGKPWTQRDLAQVLGKQELAVREMELRDIGLNDISRRYFLTELFGIPPLLLGLVELPSRKTDYALASTMNNMSNAIDLAFYEAQLHRYYNTHHRRASYEHLSNIQKAIASLYQTLPFSHGKELWHLLSRYHILIASILRDQSLFNEALLI